MTRTLTLLLMVGMISGGAANASDLAQEFPIGFDDLSHAASTLEVSGFSPEYTSISLVSPEIRVEDVTLNYETYQWFDVPGEPVFYREGYPSVPHVTRFYRIPNTGSVDLVITEATYSLVDNMNALPVLPEERRFSQTPIKAMDVYGEDVWYPSEAAMVGEPMIMRDFRVVPVTLFPVQVNTATGQARLYDQLNVDLVANDVPGENEIHRTRPVSKSFAPIYADMIANLDESELDDIVATPSSYLIICKENATVLQWADTLATWKRRRGFNVIIEARPNWSAVSMRNFIEQIYDDPANQLEFVCIIGDADFNSTYYVPTGTSGHNGRYDYYFATIDGNDDLADVAVGRLSASSSSHLSTIMGKIMAYEREPHMDDTGWYDRAFLYAGTGTSISSNEILMLWARNQFQNLTGIDNPYVATHPGNVNNSLINSQLNAGVSFFLWRGSVIGEMQNSAAYNTNNGTKLPVVLTITCGTGDYNNGTSISEAWLQAGSAGTPKGGVCGIGTATVYTHVQFNNTVAGGLVYNICNLNTEYLGWALVGAKVQLFRAFPNSSGPEGPEEFARWNNLMGDPGLSMWTDEPVVMDCSHPGTINAGARRVTVQALDEDTGEPITDAYVVLWKGEESYTRGYTDEGGFVDMPVTVDTPGDLLLTVTKRNHKPYLATIACVDAAQMTTYESYTVDDDNAGGSSGNNDGNFNPGEIIDLNVTLRNHGTQDTTYITSVTMTSDNPKIVVVNESVSYPDISPGEAASGSSAFRIAIDASMKHLETAKLSLAVQSSAATTYSTIEIVAQAGDAVFVSSQVSGGDNDSILEPGETVNLRVTVRNEGGLDMDEVTGELISRTSQFSVIDDEGGFGQINIGSSGNNAGSLFQVRANSAAYPGSLANVLLILTYGDGSVDSVAFSQPLGVASVSDPTGPDAYGYYAYDNIDTDFSGDPFPWLYNYSYLDIGAIGTRLNEASSDPGEQWPTGVTNSNLVTLPFPFRFYGQEYTQITVCSNGWAAFGDQDNLDMFRNYPIPAQQAPDAMLAPFWDDLRTTGGSDRGVWVYHDTDNDRFIIHWKAQALYSNFEQNFQILLLDPLAYPTDDDNGVIVFQYETIQPSWGQNNDVAFETIGIQAPGSLIGLPYRFNNTGAAGAASLIDHRAITITTQANVAAGSLQGHVVDAVDNEPLEGTIISIDGEGQIAETDANGDYFVSDFLIGAYALRATLFGYNDGVIENFVIEQDSLEIGNFSMLHPEIELSTDHIEVVLPDDPAEASFSITNDGNGPLDYQITVAYSFNGNEASPWETVIDFDLSEPTGDFQIHGCEFLGDFWYVTGTHTGSGRKVYRFDIEGNYVGSFNQPWSPSDFGWQDLATDGTLLYGSGGPDIVGVNSSGVLQASISGAPGVNPKSALAYDPATDHFWTADYMTDVYELGRDGIVYNQFPAGMSIKGLAWNEQDPQGYKLYIFHRTELHFGAHVSRMHPISGDIEYLRELDSAEGDRAGGCAITSDWNSALQVFAGVVQGSSGDRLDIRQLSFDTDWFSVSPANASVNAGSNRDVSIFFSPEGMRDFSYDLNLYIRNNSAVESLLLPVTLITALAAPELPAAQPHEYSLAQNYPNPFNGSTTFEFELKRSGLTTLTIYNLLGQEIARVVNGFYEAGRHNASFNLRNAASGVYLYRLESSEFSNTRKLVLLK